MQHLRGNLKSLTSQQRSVALWEFATRQVFASLLICVLGKRGVCTKKICMILFGIMKRVQNPPRGSPPSLFHTPYALSIYREHLSSQPGSSDQGSLVQQRSFNQKKPSRQGCCDYDWFKGNPRSTSCLRTLTGNCAEHKLGSIERGFTIMRLFLNLDISRYRVLYKSAIEDLSRMVDPQLLPDFAYHRVVGYEVPL